MNEPQYKPITGVINVDDIQEIMENNRFYQEEIKRLKNTLDEIEGIVYANMSNIDARISVQDALDRLNESKDQ